MPKQGMLYVGIAWSDVTQSDLQGRRPGLYTQDGQEEELSPSREATASEVATDHIRERPPKRSSVAYVH